MAIREHISTSSVNPEVSENRRGHLTLLTIGDILVFIIFAVIGMRSHKEALTVPSVLITAAPFAIGWFLVSPFIGVFRRNVTERVSRMSLRTLLAWLIAWPVGLILRGIIRHEVPPVSFAIVTLITNAVFLQLWRVPFAWFTGRRVK